MAIKKFNAVSGFSVGDDIIVDVIDSSANVSANSLTVTANSNLGDVGNITISGGSAGYVLKTDGTGNLSWGIDTSSAGGTNTQVQFNNNSSLDGSANYTFNSSTNTLNVTGTITRDSKNVTTYVASSTPPSSPKMGDTWYDIDNDITYQYIFDGATSVWVDVSSGFISASVANTAGLLVQRDANGNIYATGFHGSSLNITGNTTLLGNTNLGSVGNITISGGSAGYVLKTDGEGNLSWGVDAAAAGGNTTEIQFNNNGVLDSNLNLTYDTTTSTLEVAGTVDAVDATIGNVTVRDTLVLGSQTFYPQGANGFSVNEDFDAASTSTQTAFHFAAAEGRSSVVLDLAIQGEYTTMIGTYGTALSSEFVIGSETANTNFVFKNQITTQPVDFPNGVDLLTIESSGNVIAAGSLAANNASLGNLVSANYFTGTLTTNSQPNITSVGTLTSLTVDGNVTSGNVKTDHLLYSNGDPYIFTTSAGGTNTQVQFNDQTLFSGSANFTFNKTTKTLAVDKIVANGSGITYITASNVYGQVGNALVAANVYNHAQPNITSVGTLTGLAVNGITNLGGIGNIRITGGLPGYAMTTDGTGNLTWSAVGGGGGGSGSGFVSILRDEFTGDGTTSTFTLSSTPSSIQAILVNIDGLVQLIDSYSLTGTALSFEFPPLNGEKIEVITYGIVAIAGSSGEVQYNDGGDLGSSTGFTFNKVSNALSVTGNISGGNIVSTNGYIYLDTGIIAVASGNAGIFTSGIGNINIGLSGNLTLGSTTGNVTARGDFTANSITSNTTVTATEVRMNDLYSNRTPVNVTGTTVIDTFALNKYRTAKYTIRVNSDDGYQSVETLLIHNGESAYITVYGSISTIGTDIVTISASVTSGNVNLLATTTSSNTSVNLIGTYVAD